MGEITPPALLTSKHHTDDFECGNTTLDEWLKKRALKNQNNGASKTFVVCKRNRVIGYYALATGSVEREMASGPFSRNMPEPIPVIVLGRLAVDKTTQAQGIGSALLKDAMLRTLQVANNVGVRGILVHAISDDARRFYLRYGFSESTIEPMTLMISVANILKHLP